MGSAGRPRAMYNAIDVTKYVLKSNTADDGLRTEIREGINKAEVTICILENISIDIKKRT